jgi:hypothetical protein
VLALGGLVAIAFLVRDNDPPLYRGGFLVVALLAAVLVGAAGHPATRLGRILGAQPLRWLGQRSYAFYLWHWPVAVLTRPGIDIPITGWANTVLRLAITLALAELSYWLVERPFRKPHGVRVPVRVRRRVLRPALLSVLLVACGTTLGFQLSAQASMPVAGAPVDDGPELSLGQLPTGTPSGQTPVPRPNVTPKPGPTTGPAQQTGPPAEPLTVAWFGDSQGMTLLLNKPKDTGRYLATTDATISGCGILLGRVTSRTGERRDLAANCPNWLMEWSGDAKRIRPDVAVVMIGAWDVFDLTTSDGVRLAFGTKEWDDNFTAALDAGIGALRQSGAKVALSLLPCYRPVRASAGYWPERGDDPRTRHVNELLRAAADGRNVFVVEPPTEFCTDPAIGASLNYRWDGIHYYKPGSALYFKTVIPQLLALPR